MKVPFVVSMLCALLTACWPAFLPVPSDPAEGYTFVNETDQTLAFYVAASSEPWLGGDKPLGPRSSINWSVFLGGGSFSWIRVAATREDGQWVFDRTYSTDEWKMAGRRVVVSSLTAIAPPSDVDVIPYEGAPRPFLPSGRLPGWYDARQRALTATATARAYETPQSTPPGR